MLLKPGVIQTISTRQGVFWAEGKSANIEPPCRRLSVRTYRDWNPWRDIIGRFDFFFFSKGRFWFLLTKLTKLNKGLRQFFLLHSRETLTSHVCKENFASARLVVMMGQMLRIVLSSISRRYRLCFFLFFPIFMYFKPASSNSLLSVGKLWIICLVPTFMLICFAPRGCSASFISPSRHFWNGKVIISLI